MNYIIKNIGNYSIAEQYDILKIIQRKKDCILFHSYATQINELSAVEAADLTEEYFEGYCDNIIYLEKAEQEKIKELVIKILNEKASIYDKTYYDILRENRFHAINNKYILNRIKEVIFIMIFNSITPFRKNFVEERKVFINHKSLDEDGMKEITSSNIWYKPKNFQEIIFAMETEVHYAGIMLRKSQSFEEYSIAFVNVETADNYDLYILVNNYDDFEQDKMDIIVKRGMEIIKL